MGKQLRGKRIGHHSKSPTGLVSVKDAEERQLVDESEHPISATITKLLESLCSPNTETRICACSSIANFATEAFSELVRAGVVKILAPLLVDENTVLRTNALGALRNLSVAGDVGMCERMVKDDVMTPLCALLHKLCGIFTKPEDNKQQFEVFEQAVHLLWNLCESSDVAVTIFNKQQLCNVLLLAFTSDVCSVPLLTVTAQCLLTVADDNQDVINTLSKPDAVESFYRYFRIEDDSTDTMLLKVYVAGILCAINVSTENKSQLITDVIVFLSSILDLNVTRYLQQVLDVIVTSHSTKKPTVSMDTVGENGAGSTEEQPGTETMQNTNGAENSVPHSPRKDPRGDKEITLNSKMTEAKNLIQAQQTALEILTNLTCPLDEEEEDWEDLESSDTSADELSMETDSAPQVTMEESMVTSDVTGNIMKHGVIDRVLEKCQPNNQTIIEKLLANSDTNTLVGSLARLRSCSLLCLSNIVGVLSTDEMANAPNVNIGNALTQMWAQVGEILNTALSSSPPEQEIGEASSSALRAILDKLEDISPEKLQAVSEVDLRWLCSTELSCDTAQTRVNLLRVVACIGSALAHNESPHPHLKGIGEFFCQVCSREQEIWVIAECLDCIYDVFGEDHLNSILKQIQLIDKLKVLLPTLKSKFQQQKGILGEHLPIVSMAKTNLSRFIKYKTKVMK